MCIALALAFIAGFLGLMGFSYYASVDFWWTWYKPDGTPMTELFAGLYARRRYIAASVALIAGSSIALATGC